MGDSTALLYSLLGLAVSGLIVLTFVDKIHTTQEGSDSTDSQTQVSRISNIYYKKNQEILASARSIMYFSVAIFERSFHDVTSALPPSYSTHSLLRVRARISDRRLYKGT